MSLFSIFKIDFILALPGKTIKASLCIHYYIYICKYVFLTFRKANKLIYTKPTEEKMHQEINCWRHIFQRTSLRFYIHKKNRYSQNSRRFSFKWNRFLTLDLSIDYGVLNHGKNDIQVYLLYKSCPKIIFAEITACSNTWIMFLVISSDN